MINPFSDRRSTGSPTGALKAPEVNSLDYYNPRGIPNWPSSNIKEWARNYKLFQSPTPAPPQNHTDFEVFCDSPPAVTGDHNGDTLATSPTNPFATTESARQPLTEIVADIVKGSVTDESDEDENIPPVRAVVATAHSSDPVGGSDGIERGADLASDALGSARNLIEQALAQRQQDCAELSALRASAAMHEQEASQRSSRINGLLERLTAAATSLVSIQEDLAGFATEIAST